MSNDNTTHIERIKIGSFCPQTHVCSSRDIEDDTIAVLLSTLPTGEWTEWKKFGDVLRRTKACRHTYVIWRDVTVPPVLSRILAGMTYIPPGEYRRGQIVTQDRPGYYAEYSGPIVAAGNDFCHYCGADCGPESTGRNGFDCPVCGGS